MIKFFPANGFSARNRIQEDMKGEEEEEGGGGGGGGQFGEEIKHHQNQKDEAINFITKRNNREWLTQRRRHNMTFYGHFQIHFHACKMLHFEKNIIYDQQ